MLTSLSILNNNLTN